MIIVNVEAKASVTTTLPNLPYCGNVVPESGMSSKMATFHVEYQQRNEISFPIKRFQRHVFL
jgi:hypothetical protein